MYSNLTSATGIPCFITQKHAWKLDGEAFNTFKVFTNDSKLERVVPVKEDRSFADIELISGVGIYI